MILQFSLTALLALQGPVDWAAFLGTAKTSTSTGCARPPSAPQTISARTPRPSRRNNA